MNFKQDSEKGKLRAGETDCDLTHTQPAPPVSSRGDSSWSIFHSRLQAPFPFLQLTENFHSRLSGGGGRGAQGPDTAAAELGSGLLLSCSPGHTIHL